MKERLIGAAVLVALGVWLIPWVLDGKQEQMEVGSSGDALRLPAPDQPLPIRSQTLRLEETESAVEAEPLASESVPAEASAESAKPSAAAPSSDARAAPGADAAPAAAAPLLARAEPKPAALGPAAAAPPAKPAVDSAASRPPVPRTDAKGDWVVQLGSFGEEENAKRQAQRVNTYGYKPDVSSVRASGRAMYRVRVGPYATRAQADAAASALSAHGFVAQVVAAD